MPVYEYTCPACGPFDELRGIESAAEPASCPACGEPGARSYSVTLGSSRLGTLATGSRERLERAHEGQPTSKRVKRSGGSPTEHGGHGRPWMIGH